MINTSSLLLLQATNKHVLTTRREREILKPASMATHSWLDAHHLLHRLDHLEARLKQLEEKRSQDTYFCRESAKCRQEECHQFPISPPSALQKLHIKALLMDRLRLLDNRILQLGSEVEKRSGSPPSSEEIEIEWLQPALPDATRRKDGMLPASGKFISRKFHRGLHYLQPQRPKLLVEDSKKTSGGTKEEKKASECRNEKRRVHDNLQSYRRWFAIGC